MANYCQRIWKLRYFWLSLVRMDLRQRYSESWLGFGWSLLHPLAMTSIICVVFVNLFNADIREFGPSLLTGICFWNLISGGVSGGCGSFRQGERYIRQYPAPIVIYPLRVVLGAAFHFLLALVVVVGLCVVLRGGVDFRLIVMCLPIAVLNTLLFSWAVGVLAAFATTYFPDTEHFTEVGLQAMFYVTPIIYPPAMMRDRGLGFMLDYNPFAALLETIRRPILYGQMPTPAESMMALGATAFASLAAVLAVRRLERTVIFHM